MNTLYAGGAVDYTKGDYSHTWRHELAARIASMDWKVFCPICENTGNLTDRQVILNNEIALYYAERAVFLLDGTFTVGTPIEIAAKLEQSGPRTLAVVHPGRDRGLYVRTWEAVGVCVFSDMREVVPWLES